MLLRSDVVNVVHEVEIHFDGRLFNGHRLPIKVSLRHVLAEVCVLFFGYHGRLERAVRHLLSFLHLLVLFNAPLLVLQHHLVPLKEVLVTDLQLLS